MSTKFLAACFMCMTLASCNYLGQNNVPTKIPRQRFVPVPREGAPAGMPWSGAFALDTKTGQLCWTYGGMTNNSNTQWPNLPECVKLYHSDPD